MSSLPHIDSLQEAYSKMRERNPSFSLNAFARHIGMPASHLNEVLNQKCGLSESKARQILDKIEMSDLEKKLFLLSVKAHHSRSAHAKAKAKQELRKLAEAASTQLELEKFSMVSSWYHFAILELMKLDEFRPNAQWISGRLNVDPHLIQKAIERLKSLGLIKESRGQWTRHDGLIETQSEVPSLAIKKYHSQILSLAEKSLFSVPVEEREYNSVMVAVDSEAIDEAKKKVVEFQRDLLRELTKKSVKKDTLLCASIQLFPITRAEKQN